MGSRCNKDEEEEDDDDDDDDDDDTCRGFCPHRPQDMNFAPS